MRFTRETALLFFIACLIIGTAIGLTLILLPTDVHNVCDPYLNNTKEQVNFYCICSKAIIWP